MTQQARHTFRANRLKTRPAGQGGRGSRRHPPGWQTQRLQVQQANPRQAPALAPQLASWLAAD